MAKLIHSMIRVLNEERSTEFYKKAFSLKVADRLDFESFVLIYLSNDESTFELELTVNKDQKDSYNLGNGYGHICLSVDNLEAEHERFEREGLKPRKLVDFKNKGETVAKFFFVTDPDGYEIEVVQRQGRFI